MSFIATALGTKVAIATLSLVVLGGGTAVAASAGVLPIVPSSASSEATASATPTDEAPETDAPSAEPTESPRPTASPESTRGPDATGPAAFGLCTAFTAGGLHSTSTAYAALLRAAQSSGSIASYCAPILAARSGSDHPDSDGDGPEVPSMSSDNAHGPSHAPDGHAKISGGSSHGH